MTTITNINTFAETVKAELSRRLDGFDIREQDIVKMNDIRMKGLVCRRAGADAGPTVYMDGAYEAYCDGESVDSIIDSLIVTVLNAGSVAPVESVDDIDLSFESIRDRLTIRLIDTERNADYLKEHPYREIGAGLALITAVDLGNDYSFVMTNSVAGDYDMDKVFDTAITNMQDRFPAKLMDLGDAIFGESRNLLESSAGFLDGMSTLTIDGDAGFGASALVYEGITERIYDLYGSEYFLLPSSLHEWILVPDNSDFDAESLKNMVLSANETVVAPTDVLSNSVFHFGADGLRRVA